MHKMILSLMVLMVLMLACIMPAMACDGFVIHEKGSSLYAPIYQADLVDTSAVIDYRSSGVLLSCYTDLTTASVNAKIVGGDTMIATYNPGHDQFGYGELIFSLIPA